MREKIELQLLASFVHGILFGFHVLGVVYNVRKGNRLDATIHTLAGGYDLWAMNKHIRQVREYGGTRLATETASIRESMLRAAQAVIPPKGEEISWA